MTVLSDWQEGAGLSDHGAAALLSERLGREITVHGYKTQKGRPRPPKDWTDLLGLQVSDDPDPEPVGDGEPGDDGEPPRDRSSSSAEPRGGGRSTDPAPSLDFDVQTARGALIEIYKLAGGLLAQANRDPEIGRMFASQAPILADDWIALAKVNSKAARFVRSLGTAGPAGMLMWHHASLVIAVMSRRGRNGSVETPRAAEAVHVLHPEPEQAPPGSGAAAGSGGSVGDARTAPAA